MSLFTAYLLAYLIVLCSLCHLRPRSKSLVNNNILAVFWPITVLLGLGVVISVVFEWLGSLVTPAFSDTEELTDE